MFHYLPEFSVCLLQTNLIKVDTNRLWFLIDLENPKVQSLGAKGGLDFNPYSRFTYLFPQSGS